MLDLDNDEVFEAALLSSLGAPIRPASPQARPSGEVQAHLSDLLQQEMILDTLSGEVSDCGSAAIPTQREAHQVVSA